MKRFLFILTLVVMVITAIVVPAQVATAEQVMWSVPGDFATIQEAIDSSEVQDGDIILVKPGNHAGALVTKSVEIHGEGNAVIDDGPVHRSGMSQGFRLLAGSDGATISHLEFRADLAIMNGGAVDDVVIDHNVFYGAVQAVSNWRGSGWTISHNDITDLKTRDGGGIGILIGDYFGGIVEDNVVSQNKISGTLFVGGAYDDPGDEGGGYNGSGIVLYADFRWGAAGASDIRDNQVAHNTVIMVSNNPTVVDVVALELTDTRDDTLADPYPVIYDNAIGFNDFRGTALQIVLTPEELADVNTISRNLGDNRGQGLHPSLFM